ncbi:MAG TPA: PucR family transcriptional regulator [Intrasporangiaceae bacterium]|nr:PucR family transcriptional regulator [Intrasporangiaceae bacterium]
MVDVANDLRQLPHNLPDHRASKGLEEDLLAALSPPKAPASARWRSVARAEGIAEAELSEAVVSLLDRQAAMIQREEDAHRILNRIVLAGGSLTELCADIVSVLGAEGRAAAIVTTTDGRLLAEGGAAHALEHVHALDCFDRTGRLIVESEPVGLRREDGERSRRAMVRILAGSADLGRLAAFSMDRRLDAEDIHLLQRAATVAALAITKDHAVSAVESKYRAEFLRDALSGRAGRETEAIAHAESLGWNIDRPMVVVVAETDENDLETDRSPEEVRALQQRFVRAWVNAIGARDPSIPVAGFSQEVVSLFPVQDGQDTEAIMRMVTDVVRVVSGDGGGGRRTFSTGVSRLVRSPAGLSTAYSEALKAVSVGRQMHGTSAVAHFDSLGIYRLLALIPDSADLRRFVEESLGPLATDDSPEHADLRHTLSVLIDTNMNVAETARLLFFHYNTLRYRIAKLERLLGPFGTDPQLRLTLALALRIHEMKGI